LGKFACFCEIAGAYHLLASIRPAKLAAVYHLVRLKLGHVGGTKSLTHSVNR